jgi:malate dehydrogenase (oxaloacetate-decarboxylating)
MMRDVMIREGLSEQEATGRFWAVDSRGLLTNDYAGPLRDFQQPYCRPVAEVECRPRHATV